jgi:hypothetical protein
MEYNLQAPGCTVWLDCLTLPELVQQYTEDMNGTTTVQDTDNVIDPVMQGTNLALPIIDQHLSKCFFDHWRWATYDWSKGWHYIECEEELQ